MKKLLFFILTCAVISCGNPVRKAISTLDNSPVDAAKYCADKYPVKDSIVYKDSLRLDTLYMGDIVFDTVVTKDTVYITKTLPAKTITKTIAQVKEVFRENTARVTQLQLELAAKQQEADKLQGDLAKSEGETKLYKGQRNKARLNLWLVIAVAGARTFRKRLLGLLKFA